MCYLLGIRSADQLADHPLRGAIFETWVVSEILKSRAHRGLPPALSFFRDRRGAEVDLLVELGRSFLAIETKSGQTVAADFFAGLRAFESHVDAARLRRSVRSFVVYGGGETQRRSAGKMVSWSDLDRQKWWDPAE